MDNENINNSINVKQQEKCNLKTETKTKKNIAHIFRNILEVIKNILSFLLDKIIFIIILLWILAEYFDFNITKFIANFIKMFL